MRYVRLRVTIVGLSVLALCSCQAAPPKQEEPPAEGAMLEESFEEGDTGEFERSSDDSIETEEAAASEKE